MYNFKEYLTEGLFSKTFEEKIQEIEKLEISSQKYIAIMQSSILNGKRFSSVLNQIMNIMVKLSDKLADMLAQDGRKFNQEQINIIVGHYSYLNRTLTVPLDYRRAMDKFAENNNIILNILYWLKNTKQFIIQIDERKFNNPIVIEKKGRYITTVHKSAFDRHQKEMLEIHGDIDPLGEEDWNEN